jgi:hypothetical protein
MSRRRSSFEPLLPSHEPRWLVVRNMQSAALEQQVLAPGSDLYGAFIKALAAHVEAGWQMETFSSNQAFAFCHRGTERRFIGVESHDPNRARGDADFSKGLIDVLSLGGAVTRFGLGRRTDFLKLAWPSTNSGLTDLESYYLALGIFCLRYIPKPGAVLWDVV